MDDGEYAQQLKTSVMTGLNATFWNNRYLQEQTGWDTGAITPPLKAYIDQLTDKHTRILIPGCGNSYEALYLQAQGCTQVTVIDIADIPCARLRSTLALHPGAVPTVIHGDFFEHAGQYDLILEQTFFCALDPSMRLRYAEHMHQLLKPGGRLAGVLFNRDFEGGPPFGGHEPEYRALFSPYFDIVKMEPCYNSIAPRMGQELFVILRKRENG